MTIGIKVIFAIGIIHPLEIGISAILFYMIGIGKIVFNPVTTVTKHMLIRMKNDFRIKGENKN